MPTPTPEPTLRGQTEKSDINNNDTNNAIPCARCKRSPQRDQFQKKEFKKKDLSPPVCHHCKRKASALRCKQPPPPVTLRNVRESETRYVRRPNNFGYCNYIDKLFGLKCFGDIVALRAFTTAKDVSESMGAINGAVSYGNIDTKDEKENGVLCLCIGDGCTPRSAVLVAFTKGWRCVSIDPALSKDWAGEHPTVRGLTGYPGTLESFMKEESSLGLGSSFPAVRHLVLLCVHSHAVFQNTTTVSNLRGRYGNPKTTLVSLPCCPRFRHVRDVGRPPDKQYDDDCVFSACRTVYIWNFEKQQQVVMCGEVSS